MGKIISIYGNKDGTSRIEYAINLAAALYKVTQEKALFIAAGFIMPKQQGIINLIESSPLCQNIDILVLKSPTKQSIWHLKDKYKFIVINISEEDNIIFDFSDTIHFFIDSTKDNLDNSHIFLESLLEKGMNSLHSKFRIVINRLDIFDKFSIEEISWLIKRDLWAIVPELGAMDQFADSKGLPIVLKDPALAYSKSILYIAKQESKKLLGLALGSGAAFGLAHIGVIKVLERNKIPIDVISGASIGALIASMIGLGFSSEKMEQIAKRLNSKLNIMRLLDFTIPISGILAGKRLKRFLKKVLGEKTFEDLKTPVKIIVYDLANRDIMCIDKGDLVEAVYKSVSVPGIFKPHMDKDRMIVDGGVADPVPVDILLKEGAQKIIAVNVLPGPADIYKRNMLLKQIAKNEEEAMHKGNFAVKAGIILKRGLKKFFTPNIFDVIVTTIQSMEYVIAETNCKKANISLHPVFADATSMDFHYVKDFIITGEREALSYINDIKKLAFE